MTWRAMGRRPGREGDTRPAQRQQRRDRAGCWPAVMWDWGLGVFLQLSTVDVDSRRGFAAFPRAFPCGVHCRWPTPLWVAWGGMERALSPHVDSCGSPLSLGAATRVLGAHRLNQR